MNNKEFKKLKNTIALKALIKIIIYTVIASVIITSLIDVIYNDDIASIISRFSTDLYRFLVYNKPFIMLIGYALINLLITFLVIRNTNNALGEILLSMDSVLKNPNKEIKLPNDLLVVENSLNKIRIDLIAKNNEAKEAEKRKNDLIVYLAHDLKTPLTSVMGYLTLLVDEDDVRADLRKKYLEIALNKATRLEDLINQLFDITRYNLQGMTLNKKLIDLVVLFEQLVEECYPMLEDKKLKCLVNKPNSLFYNGDGDKLARAFENLLKNAINYSYENSTIEIKVEELDKEIRLSFRNEGDKIPSYKLEKIFDKFYRADDARTSSTGGTGLGLAITKQIIELHNGSITVKNDDEFIVFNITLIK